MNDNQVRFELDELQEEGPSVDTQTNLLTPEQREEFFKATEDGSIELLEQLFDKTTNADPNMTQFTESLLMAAIRSNQNEVAEYLIDQLAINVQYTADLREFRLRRQNPIRHRRFSCRDLAYNQGMMELVDLIDLTSDDVTPSVKRYLRDRLQRRLDIIHQAYLKRFEERNQYNQKEKENRKPSTVNITDENNIPLMLPPTIDRSYKSHIEEVIQSIDTTKDKSIDQTGKKTFRFSNYTLRFRLLDRPEINQKNIEQPQTPSLPTISLFTLPSTPLITTNNTHRTISRPSSRFLIRDTRTSICRSARRANLPQMVPMDNKPSMTTTKQFLPKRVNQNSLKYNYIPQQQHALYNQPQHFMSASFKSTPIGLSTNTRIIRD